MLVIESRIKRSEGGEWITQGFPIEFVLSPFETNINDRYI